MIRLGLKARTEMYGSSQRATRIQCWIFQSISGPTWMMKIGYGITIGNETVIMVGFRLSREFKVRAYNRGESQQFITSTDTRPVDRVKLSGRPETTYAIVPSSHSMVDDLVTYFRRTLIIKCMQLPDDLECPIDLFLHACCWMFPRFQTVSRMQ